VAKHCCIAALSYCAAHADAILARRGSRGALLGEAVVLVGEERVALLVVQAEEAHREGSLLIIINSCASGR